MVLCHLLLAARRVSVFSHSVCGTGSDAVGVVPS